MGIPLLQCDPLEPHSGCEIDVPPAFDASAYTVRETISLTIQSLRFNVHPWAEGVSIILRLGYIQGI